MHLLLGSSAANHLVLRPLRRSAPEATDAWDGNWLKVDVEARGGAFRGEFQADLRSDELARFAEALAPLPGAAEGAAALESAEGWVAVRLAVRAPGRLVGTCEVRDDPALGALLRFGIELDEPGLRALIAGLRDLLLAFPVVGDPQAEGELLLAAGDDPGLA